jgi:hypothetical protein
LEAKLEVLKSGGLEFRYADIVERLMIEFDRETFEKPGYDILLRELVEYDPPRCYNLCEVNLDRFESDLNEGYAKVGDFAAAIKPLVDITQGALKIEILREDLDQKKVSWIEFRINGETHKVSFRRQDKTLSARVIHLLSQLLYAQSPTLIYATYHDNYLACITRDQLKKLNENGIAFEEVK